MPQQTAKKKEMAKIERGYLNLRQACQYLGIGESTGQRIWPLWEKEYGVVPSRFPKKTLKFRRADLDRMMESTKVVFK